MKEFLAFAAALGLCLVIGGCCLVLPAGCGVAKVAQDQFGVTASLKKYEEFKDIAAKLDAKLASIKVAEGRLERLEEQYKGVARKDWARVDAEQSSLWASEVAGMKSSFNSLAADYNAKMSKFSHAYANVGELPKGADKPLPREYKPYETK